MEPEFCPFCDPKPADIIVQNDLAYARVDLFPVNPGHTLVLPFRHESNYFELSREEQRAILQLVDEVRKVIDARHHPAGYNIGVNVGEVAGQTVPHVHFHVIPRYTGDVQYARGGIRAVIPGKRDYPVDMPEE